MTDSEDAIETDKGDCLLPNCPVPRPHRHTGEIVDTSYDEWWCPTNRTWEMCPGPCPDGTEHGPKRVVPATGERVELLP